MDYKPSLLVLLMLSFFLGAAADKKHCYYCSDNHISNADYDSNCGNPNYDGHSEKGHYVKGCSTIVYDNGHTWRGFESKNQASHDQKCQYNWDEVDGYGMRCWCPDNYCNSHQCEDCFPTTITTTTTTTTTTQIPPGKELSCYNCIDCPTVDENTPVVFDENFLTCVTSLTDQGTVIRSGGFVEYPDGHCFVDGTVTQCHCTTPLCNNAGITGLSCYNCYDCPTVDVNTPAEFDPSFLTCVTITTDAGTVIRSGSFDAHSEGECVVDGIMTKCHCTTFLCNNTNETLKTSPAYTPSSRTSSTT